MAWYLRKSFRIGPVRINLSRSGIGMSTGVRGLRVGTGPRGPYVAGGRGGLYFRQSLGRSRRRSRPASPPTPHVSSSTQGMGTPPTRGTAAPYSATPYTNPPAASDQSSAPAPFPARPYQGWLLLALVVAYVLSIATEGVLPDLGASLILAVTIALCVLDWRGFTTLNGRIHWQRTSGWARAGLVFAYLCVWIMPGLYLAFTARDWLRARQDAAAREPIERQRHIAELEAQLGMAPHTEGTCRVCHKPLQLGAEWCAYCGAPVVERPRVCPNCATVTLPDAHFCPTCRAPLPPVSQPS